MAECDLTCATIEAITEFKYNGVSWDTEIDEATCNLDNLLFFDNIGDFNAGSIVTINTNGNLKEPFPEWEWAVTAGGTLDERIYGITVDCCGNVYIAADFASTVIELFDQNNVAQFTLTNSGGIDTFIAKLTTSGEWAWAAHLSGTGSEVEPIVITDKCNNLYVVGDFSSNTASFYNADQTLSNVVLTKTDPDPDAYVAKMDTDGNWHWAARIGGLATDDEMHCAVSCDGRIYVTGRYFSTQVTFFNADGSDSGFTYPVTGTRDAFVAHISVNGYWLWTTRIEGSNNDHVTQVATDCCNNIYFTGQFNSVGPTFDASDLTFHNSDGTLADINVQRVLTHDIVVAKLTHNGFWEWGTNVGGLLEETEPSIATDAEGNSYVSGGYKSLQLTFFNAVSQEGVFTLINENNITATVFTDDGFIAKINTHGEWQWALRIAGPDASSFTTSIVIDSYNYLYASRRFRGEMTFYNIDDTPGFTLTSKANVDLDNALGKLSSDGIWQWIHQIGGVDDDFIDASNIAIDCFGNIYFVNRFQSIQLTFFDVNDNPALTVSNTQIDGSLDIAIAKLNNDATILGIVQPDNLVGFKDRLSVSSLTMATGEFPPRIGTKYFYDPEQNRLTYKCRRQNVCQQCVCSSCLKLITYHGIYGIGMPSDTIQVI